MLFIYNIAIYIYTRLVSVFSLFNRKAELWIKGQKNLLGHISSSVNAEQKHTWFHFASLGEFEQGRPVLEELKKRQPDKKLVITFFSPSGYEVRKDYPLADHVFYLPADTLKNAKEFIRLINPEVAVFTKYEYWYHYFNELHKQQVPLYVISAIFRPQQVFFKWYGTLNRKMLKLITRIFIQDEQSKVLLETIGIKQVTVSGDTRFDRVAENALHPKEIPEILRFTGNAPTFIAGSTWPDDEKLIAELAGQYPGWKFIIAPHEIEEDRIGKLCRLLPAAMRFSKLKSLQDYSGMQVLIIDNIGMLSSLYRYGQTAYIGGGFGKGIHNTLEAAAFGIPVIFGPNYRRFREATELIACGGAFSIDTTDKLQKVFFSLTDPVHRINAGKNAYRYIQAHKGATKIILDRIGGVPA